VNISPGQYGTLNSLYFFPNIITPLLVGTASQHLGGPTLCLIYAVFIASIGHTIFALACQLESVNLLFIGRILAGCVYEVIDFLPIVCTGALFKDEWGMIVGATNAFLRAGSVATFVVGPFVYQQVGLVPAMWLSAVIALLSVPIAVGAYWLIKKLTFFYQNQFLDSSPLSDPDPETQRGFLASPAEVYAKRGRRLSEGCLSPSPRVSDSYGESESAAMSLAPFLKLSRTYYLFACAGMLLYGSMVPFWFTGSKYLQEFYGLSVQNAGALILIPEGSIILLSFPLGFLLDNWIKSAHLRLALLGVSTLLLPLGYVLLMTGWRSSSASPLGSMLTLGFGYGVSNCMYWTSLMQIIPEDLIGPGSGLIASSLNVMPAVVPIVAAIPVSFASPGDWNLMVLSCLGCLSTLCSMTAAYRMYLVTSAEQQQRDQGGAELLDSETVRLLNSPGHYTSYKAVSVRG
jgi:MFS family permease